MIYNNLLYFLTAIFTFSMATPDAKTLLLPVWAATPLFLVLVVIFDRFAKGTFRKYRAQQSAGYFKAEKRVALAALLLFAVFVFGLDLKYYLDFLSFGDTIPAFVNIAGLLVFLILFVIVWHRARPSYEAVFSRKYTGSEFIFSNIKANLPIVIPWMILTLCYDLIALVQWPWLQKLVDSRWGDLIFFAAFFLFVFTLFPPLVRKLWSCKKLADGPLRDHLLAFCKKQNFSAELYLWPLFEGRVITAGVMGVVPGLRYILITPALIETMNLAELESVMVHEIGHVKRFHLLLYVLLIGGFIAASGFLAEPLYFSFFSQEIFYSFVEFTGFSPDSVRNVLVAVPALLFLLVYFRYVFGYFMRNFERQADLQVFPALGDSRAIISAFEKIAMLSGNIRDEPSWHHFGIGERVDFLLRCEEDPSLMKKHHSKVAVSLVAYICLLLSALFAVPYIPLGDAKAAYEAKYVRADLMYNALQEESPGQWLFFAGNYLRELKLENRAVIAFELAMEKEPQQPEIMNNFAWLLLTSNDHKLRQPQQALKLARSAAEAKPHGYILDTLATAWWANGFVDEAIKVEKQAQFVDPEKSNYYESQIHRFQKRTYLEEMEQDTPSTLVIRPEYTKKEQG